LITTLHPAPHTTADHHKRVGADSEFVLGAMWIVVLRYHFGTRERGNRKILLLDALVSVNVYRYSSDTRGDNGDRMHDRVNVMKQIEEVPWVDNVSLLETLFVLP
jgi:hypothetical protein